MKKQILALATALSLLFSLSGAAFAAEPADRTPVIMVAGFTSTRLYENPGSPERARVWDDAMGEAGGALLGELPWLLGGAALWGATGHTGMAGNAFGRAVRSVMGQFIMGADGKPAHDVGPWPGSAAEFSCEAIWRDYPEIGQLEAICRNFADKISAGRVFVFQYDWRNSALESVRQLRVFIQQVKKLTGSRTVRLFGESYGGLICGAYLAQYAQEGDVRKAVLEIPALGGSSILPELLRDQNFYVNAGDAAAMALAYSQAEGMPEFGFLQRLLPQSLIAPLGADLVRRGLLPVMKTWGNVWDMIPADAYEATKAAMLQPGERPVWEADSDRLHREIMPGLGAALQRAQAKYGVAVRIVACTGSLLLFGEERINGDGLLDVRYTTGARVLPLGGHGLKQGGAVCGSRSHRHLSPGQDIDASAAWLPENTWFVQGLFHGVGEADPYALALETALMLDPKLNTVFDQEQYPQFGLSRHPNGDIYARFDSSQTGFVGGGDSALLIENITQAHNVRILSVDAPESGLRFSADFTSSLGPGEALRVPFSGTLAESGGYAPVEIVYLLGGGGLPVMKTKTFDISVR